MDNNYLHDEITYHAQTSVVQQLKFQNVQVISSHILMG